MDFNPDHLLSLSNEGHEEVPQDFALSDATQAIVLSLIDTQEKLSIKLQDAQDAIEKMGKELIQLKKRSLELSQLEKPKKQRYKVSYIPTEMLEISKDGILYEVVNLEQYLLNPALPVNTRIEQELGDLIKTVGLNPRKKRMLTPLHLAVFVNNESLVQKILERQPDPNTPSDEGVTPLMTAAANASLKNVRALLNAGAQKDAQDPSGNTALRIAKNKKHFEVARLLEE